VSPPKRGRDGQEDEDGLDALAQSLFRQTPPPQSALLGGLAPRRAPAVQEQGINQQLLAQNQQLLAIVHAAAQLPAPGLAPAHGLPAPVAPALVEGVPQGIDPGYWASSNNSRTCSTNRWA
jgi:hypothetical protein